MIPHGVLESHKNPSAIALDLWVVPDTLADIKFATASQLIAGAPIRFYAGVPLLAHSGQALGVLSVLDDTPRDLSLEQGTFLRVLGRQLVRQLEFRRTLADLAWAVVVREHAEQALIRLASFPEQNPHPVIELDLAGRVTYSNPAAQSCFPDLAIPELAHPFLSDLQASIAALQHGGQEIVVREVNFGDAVYEQRIRFVPESNLIRIFGYDVTFRKRAEAARAQLQEQIIHTQAETLAALSTPLIPISDRVVIMPLIGAIDSQRATQVLKTLLLGIVERRARIVILDITGVAVVDTQVAQTLLHGAHAARLLGTQMVLSGIHPEVAQTLIGLGANLRGIITHSTLQDSIAYALGQPERSML